MAINNSQVYDFGTELSATMTGSTVSIGTLPFPCSKLIFDNQGSDPVAIYVNGNMNPWRTFTPSEALTLDGDTNISKGPFAKGTSFTGNGASGTFSISYLYFQSN